MLAAQGVVLALWGLGKVPWNSSERACLALFGQAYTYTYLLFSCRRVRSSLIPCRLGYTSSSLTET